MVRETKVCGRQWSGSNQAGITLLEMLVVFALVSLISTLLLQFTGFLTSGFERTASMEREAFRSRLFQRWYQNSTAGIVASLDAQAGFHGAKESMTGYTLFPVFGPSGVPTRFNWSIQEEDDTVGIWYQGSRCTAGKDVSMARRQGGIFLPAAQRHMGRKMALTRCSARSIAVSHPLENTDRCRRIPDALGRTGTAHRRI